MKDARSIEQLIADYRPGYSLEQRFYTDPAIYSLEIEKVITRNWYFVGHRSMWQEAGDFRVFKAANESAIVVRNEAGELNAFANVCRHRGSLICLESSGNSRKLECPYHAWMYDTDGNLVAARNMPDDFDKSSHSLHRVALEIVHGLVFVCFSDDPPSLEPAKRDLAEPMAMFDFPNLKVAARKTYPIPANWKLAVENYQECYHCGPAHPDYAKLHTLMLDDNKIGRVQEHMLAKMEQCGLKRIVIDRDDTITPHGEQGYAYSRTAMFDGYKSGSRDGKPVAPLLGKLTDYDGGASDLSIGPFSFFLIYSDHAVGYVFTPTDALNCQCEVFWMVRGDAKEGVDYDVDKLTWLWDVTTKADETIIVNNWKGVKSRYYQPGPLSGMEGGEQRYIDWVLRELSAA